MRVFVTGATGHIGTAVVAELLAAGHEVVGLARSDRSAAALTAAGAGVHRGSLEELDGLRRGAAEADGVIHLAFGHDFSDYAGAVATDLRAVEAMGDALGGSGRPFVITSGTLMLASAVAGSPGTEDEAAAPASPRGEAENAAVALAARGVRSSVVRLAPSVHGPSDRHGFVPRLIGMARDKGVSAYVEDGATRWPAVHTLDAARLFRLALEAAPAGSRLHGVGDEGIPFREIAEAIGRGLDVPVKSVPREAAQEHLGFLSGFATLDNPTSNARTRELLGWRPEHPALLQDLAEGHYFGRSEA